MQCHRSIQVLMRKYLCREIQSIIVRIREILLSVGCYGNEHSAMQCHGAGKALMRKYLHWVYIYIVLMLFHFWKCLHFFLFFITAQYSSVRDKHENVTISRI